MEPSSAGSFLLRVVVPGMSGLTEDHLRITEGVATIGRDPGCTVVSADPSVSRRHAKIELRAEGFLLSDLGSGNGVWIGKRRIREERIEPGETFRIGSTVFQCVLEQGESLRTPDLDETIIPTRDATPSLVTDSASVATQGFVLKIADGGDPDDVVRQIEVASRLAIVGRAEDCTIVLKDKDISRKHAEIEVVPGGFRVTDLGSSNGTWIEGRRLVNPEILRVGQEFRVGGRTTITCEGRPLESEEELETGGTVVVQTSPKHMAETRQVEDEGELVKVGAHQAFLLDDARMAWYVVRGGIDIFNVDVKKGKPAGTRSHFLEILPGQCLFGFDLKRYGIGSGFLAVAKPDTELRKITIARLRELASTPPQAKAVATLLESWIIGLSMGLARDFPDEDVAEKRLQAGEDVVLDKSLKVSSAGDVVWIDIWSGSILFNDMATPVFKGKQVLFPVVPPSWIQPVGQEFGELSIRPVRTLEVVQNPALWQGLYVFQQVICECEFINKRLSAVDEFIRLQDKAKYSEEAKAAAYDAIGSVLRTEAVTPKEFLRTGSAEPVLQACQLVGKALDIEVVSPPDTDEDLTFEEKISAVARASGFRARVVALRGEWWQGDHGPLLGHIQATKDPVALLPTSARSYECIDPRTGTRRKITETAASSLAPFAYSFYRPFPEGALRVADVLRFGVRGVAGDLKMLLLMGIAIGLLGTLTPYFTGRIFDSAIPQAERGTLLGFGAALFCAALATSMFHLTQGVAILRAQGKMEYSIQAALWDRLLNLPANFFRKYSAGDLAERAAGIDAIQTLVAGAGISAILGSLSGIFYVFLMFIYDVRLALLAIGLTITYVGFTTAANYLQLRFQRTEIEMHGRIAGLVLNLITGVTKLRICGAEDHAFRVWAQQFSEQRRIGFSIGRVQNAVSVFNSMFPILSSMAIFIVMVSAQNEPTAERAVLTTGQFIAFSAAYGLFLASVQALGNASLDMLRVVPIYERLKPIVTTPLEVDSTKAYPGKLSGEIELSHIHFRYDEDGPWIINDLSLKIQRGDFVAIVGSSGCGKSTLFRLMLGFEQPVKGGIYYDGQDVNSLDLRMLRQQLGVVLQVSKVLPAEIYRNIVGVSSRTIEEAWAAAEMAGLAEDIRLMPMGMHTFVSEGGGTLSAGQRQRLLIARAIANRPKLIFFDEATSALDNRAQAVVTESLDRLEATRIVIAHRLSTIINADRICYLEDGKIAEMGTYEELMADNGPFARLARRQMA